eukprot:3650241-Amphidinium_carterae.1
MRDYLERALRIFEGYYGEEHHRVAATLANLGNACGSLGDALKMRDYLERALHTFEGHYGQEHPHVASTLINLGNAHGPLGDAAKQRDYRSVATALANLGVAHGCLGDAFKERDCFERALQTFDMLGQLSFAQQEANQGLRVFEASSLGAGHPGALAWKRFLAEIRCICKRRSKERG